MSSRPPSRMTPAQLASRYGDRGKQSSVALVMIFEPVRAGILGSFHGSCHSIESVQVEAYGTIINSSIAGSAFTASSSVQTQNGRTIAFQVYQSRHESSRCHVKQFASDEVFVDSSTNGSVNAQIVLCR